MGSTKEISGPSPIEAVVSDPKVQAEVKKMESVVRVMNEPNYTGSQNAPDNVQIASGYEEFKAKTAVREAMEKQGVVGKDALDQISGILKQQVQDDVKKQPEATAEDRNTVRQLASEGTEVLKKYNEAHPGNEGANPPDVRPTGGKQIQVRGS